MKIIPFGSYDVLNGMYWLNIHYVALYFHNKTLNFLYKEGKNKKIKGIP
jgi:hypothetical protein